MTSNVGSDLIRKETNIGFATHGKEGSAASMEQEHKKMTEKVTTAMKAAFRPEFLNRLDATVVFHALSKENIREIVENEMEVVRKQLALQGH